MRTLAWSMFTLSVSFTLLMLGRGILHVIDGKWWLVAMTFVAFSFNVFAASVWGVRLWHGRRKPWIVAPIPAGPYRSTIATACPTCGRPHDTDPSRIDGEP